MYANTSATGSFLTAGIIAADSGWTVTGWGLVAVATVIAGVMTWRRLTCRTRRV